MEQFRIMYKLISVDDNIENQEVILEALEFIRSTYGTSIYATVADIEQEVDDLFERNNLSNLKTEIDVKDNDIIVTIQDKNTKEPYAKANLQDIGYTVIIEVDSDEEIARRLMELKLDQFQTKDQRKRYLYLYLVKEIKHLLESGLKLGEIEARINANEILRLVKYVINLTEEESTIYIKFIDAESYTDAAFEYSTPIIDFEEQYTPPDHKIRKILKEVGLTDSVLSLTQLVNIMSERGYSNDYIQNLLLESKDLRLRISGYYNFLKNIDIIDGYALDILPLVSTSPYPYSLKFTDPAKDVKIEVGKDDIVKLEPGQLIITSGSNTTVVPLDHLKYGYTEFDEQKEKYVINITRILIIEPKVMEIDPDIFLPEQIEDNRKSIDNGLIQSYHYSWIVALKGTYTQSRKVQIKIDEDTFERRVVQDRFTNVIPYAMSDDYNEMYSAWQEVRRKTQSELDTIIRKLYKRLPKDTVLESCVVRLEQTDITEYPFYPNMTKSSIQWTRKVFLGAVKAWPENITIMTNFLTVCRWEPLQSAYIQKPYIYLDTVRELLSNWSEEQIQTVIWNIKNNISNQQTIDFYQDMRTVLTDRGWEKVEIDNIFATKTYLQENPIKQSEQLYIEDDYHLSRSDALIIMNEIDDNLCITLQTYLNIVKAHELGIPVIMWNSYSNSIYKDYIDGINPYVAYKNLYNVFTKINK